MRNFIDLADRKSTIQMPVFKIKTALLTCIVVFFTVLSSFANGIKGYSETEQILFRKNFYFLYLLENSPKTSLLTAEIYPGYNSKRLSKLNESLNCSSPACYSEKARFSDFEVKEIGNAIVQNYTAGKLKNFVLNLRQSGKYANFEESSDTLFLRKSWEWTALAINNILDIYVTGKAPRYPKIDAISFTQDDKQFREKLHAVVKDLIRKDAKENKFYTQPMLFAIKALEINGRDEAARYEPLKSGMNKKPVKQIRKTGWSKYPYSLIQVPGLGPEEEGVTLDPGGARRCDSAAKRYKNGKAPFIVVTGGHVHPNKTPFCEAVEMKKYMVDKLGIPQSVIFIEPHARHTTTNIRNVNRMIYQFNIPDNKPVLVVSDADQSKSIVNMATRCIRELGFVPYKDLKQVTKFDTEYYPLRVSLHTDANDLLDP